MRRVVVTGIGIVSSIGNSAQEVLAWNYIAMEQAIRDAGLEEKDVSNERTGLIMGSGGPSTRAIVQAADNTREKGPKKVGPFEVPKAMSSTNSATLSTPYHIKGVSYSISSACSTSAHCIGNGAELIQLGKQDIVFAGGGEELDWTLSVLFDAMNAMSSDFNDRPEVASRAYDTKRDGFVIAGGAGVVATLSGHPPVTQAAGPRSATLTVSPRTRRRQPRPGLRR